MCQKPQIHFPPQSALDRISQFTLRGAVRAARNAYDTDQANGITAIGPWFDDMLMLAPVSVVMAGAALEANANEIIRDILDGIARVSLTKCQRVLLGDLLDDRSGNAIGKYGRLSLLLDKEPKTGGHSWENANLLVKFRNSFLHFKPAWDYETAKHYSSLVKDLKNRLSVCNFYKVNFSSRTAS